MFINTAFTNTAHDLLKMAGIDIGEVKVTVDTNKVGEMRLSIGFSNRTAFKKFATYYRQERYSNLFLPHSLWEYNAKQPVEIFVNTRVLQDIVPELASYRNSLVQEKK